MMRKAFLISIVTLATFTACEKAFFEPERSSTDTQTNLNYIWNECN